MNLVDRIDKIEGVEKSYWDGMKERLSIYYDEATPYQDVNIRIQKELTSVRLLDSVKNILFISTPKGVMGYKDET